MEYIHFSRGIAHPSVHELPLLMQKLNQDNKEEEFTVLINSAGGQVVAGIDAYNMIRALPFKITMHNIGQVNSVANIIFLAANIRKATSISTFLFHSVGQDIREKVRFEERRARELLESLRRDNHSLASIVAARSKLKVNEVTDLFREQHVKDSKWALDNGFIQKIEDPKIPKGKHLHVLH